MFPKRINFKLLGCVFTRHDGEPFLLEHISGHKAPINTGDYVRSDGYVTKQYLIDNPGCWEGIEE